MNDWFEAEQRIERAQELSESRRWDEALAELDAALAINPHVALWHAQRGYLLEELDRIEDAVGAYEEALALEPDDQDVGLALGATLTRLGRFARALEVFDEIARTCPDCEPAYCHRINVYTRLGRHDQAEIMFYMAQHLDESCPHCFYHIGASLAARGQMERAIYCWRRVLELDPGYFGVNRRIAQAYRVGGEIELARDYFLREIREDPGQTDVLFELAQMTLESGQVAMAAARFAQIIELDPDHVEARFALGKIWLARGKAAEALACFDAIRSIAAGEVFLPDFELCVGDALFRLNRFSEATERFEAASAADPKNRHVLALWGGSLLAAERPDAAADCFRRILSLDARSHLAHHNLGVCLLQTDRLDGALSHCLEAVRLRPEFTPAMYNAAIAYLRLGKLPEAQVILRRAARCDPDNKDVQRLLKRFWRYRTNHRLGKLVAPLRAFARLFCRQVGPD